MGETSGGSKWNGAGEIWPGYLPVGGCGEN